MRKQTLAILASCVLLAAGYIAGSRKTAVAHAAAKQNAVPKSYGKLVTALADSIGTGLVFEDEGGVIRFVSVTGMKEGELARYDDHPAQGGIPRSYGHLVSAVVNHGTTALVFEDAQGVIRFVTLTGTTESELTRD